MRAFSTPRAMRRRLRGCSNRQDAEGSHHDSRVRLHRCVDGATPALETSRAGVRLRVLAGSAFGLTAPAPVFSPTLYVEAVMPAGATLALPDDQAERAAYVVDGSIVCDGHTLSEGDLLIATHGAQLTLKAGPASRVMLLGGAPMDGPRLIWWNFVASSQERIEKGKADWKAGRFGKIPGDDIDSIPLPER